jgi:hypothetical protein
MVSPWLSEKAAFNKQFLASVTRSGISIERSVAESNRTSLALLIEYGQARILLGGDAERRNWSYAFRNRPDLFAGGMHFVKVPHHASETAVHSDMWTGRKFFLTKRPCNTVAVATRFNRGSQLPEQSVLDKIRHAGCRVWVVADKAVPGIAGRRIGDIVQSAPLCRFQATVGVDGTVTVTREPHPYRI